jgi:hypothetical protein
MLIDDHHRNPGLTIGWLPALQSSPLRRSNNSSLDQPNPWSVAIVQSNRPFALLKQISVPQ